MTRLGWRLLSVLAHALEPAEREAVLGDVAESDQGICAAVRDLLGLMIRRQVGSWAHWQPWLAVLGVAGLAGVPLSRIAFRLNVDLGQQLMAYRKYGVHFETGLTARQDLAFLLCLAVALAVWSWACGFALGALSGRAAWLTWSAFYLVVLDSAWARFVLSGDIILRDPRSFRLLPAVTLPLSIGALLFSLPALWGTFLGVRRRVLPVLYTYFLAAATAALTILMTLMSSWYDTAREDWSGGVWLGASWPIRLLPFALVSWPAAWLLISACREHAVNERTR